ncbi:bile acid:sodium symporter family protein [Erythrobacter sp. NE805]|uniref:bile acid:sodium symporter family protein n=1 Tax=Erythrobacter sp. NE805 TaxID=3389875 RepID=UPI00396B0C60
MLNRITNNFAVLTLAGVALAWVWPEGFTWLTDGSNRIAGQPLLSIALGIIMLAMGLTLTFEDYRGLLVMPRAFFAGLALQYTIMPLSGFAVAKALGLEPGLAVGLILIACCPGGTSSNIVTFIARGHVALSVAMTMASTFAGMILTPLLTGWLAGQYVAIDRWNLFVNMVAVVLVPVVAGTLLNRLFPRAAARVSAALPVVAILLVILIVGAIVGGAKAQIVEHAGMLLLATFLLHASGFGLGYALSRALRLGVTEARTISIEVGMQNSGLGSGLAKTPAFAAQFADAAQAALAPVPAAISAMWQVLIGSLLAGWWRRRG